ncbi:hypothetical protein, partial [Schlesneria sp.]|uniref:hypothetical protein n=1 Tax=Schlesneria sp. TaxID=2762018 RepID=UPI002F145C5A
ALPLREKASDLRKELAVSFTVPLICSILTGPSAYFPIDISNSDTRIGDFELGASCFANVS